MAFTANDRKYDSRETPAYDNMRSIETITSRDNQRLKFARQVRDGKDKAFIFIEGSRLADEALRSELVITNCFAVDGSVADKILGERRRGEIDIAEVPERLFDSIADTKQSQGVILIAERPSTDKRSVISSNLLRTGVPIAVFLHEVNNPSNLGAVIRAAEAAGAAGIITSKRSADVFAPKALRASMGSAFRMPIWASADLEEALSWASENGMIITATDTTAAADHTDVDFKLPRLLIFGSEAHGLANIDPQLIEERVTISMSSAVESLNLAVSAGVILFEAKRQIDAGRK